MDAREWNEIDGLVVECTQALFGACSIATNHVGTMDSAGREQRMMLSVVGFAGSQLRGALLLSADDGILTRSHPAGTGESALPAEDLCDWSGELANQLLGRIKNQLLHRGLVIQLSTPTTLSGVDLRIGPSVRNAFCLPHIFEAGTSSIQVRFEAIAEPDVKLTENAEEGHGVQPEGELVLF